MEKDTNTYVGKILALVVLTLFIFSLHMAFVDSVIQVSDTFTEISDAPITSHTPDVGQGWIEVSDSTSAGTNALVVASTDTVESGTEQNDAGQAYSMQPYPDSASQYVQAKLSAIETGTGSKGMGLFGRRTDNGNLYFVQMVPNGVTQDSLKLYKMVNGIATQLASSDVTIAANDLIRLELKDTAKKVYVNDVEKLSSTDNQLSSAGTWGFFIGKFGGGDSAHLRKTWKLDDFNAQSDGADMNSPPIISNGKPSGSLPEGTTQATLEVDTNEAATCKYSTAANTPYDSMPNTFTTTGGTHHMAPVQLGSVTSCPWDIYPDGIPDGKVTLGDVLTVVADFGKTSASPGYNPKMDFNNNQQIDLFDVLTVLARIGGC